MTYDNDDRLTSTSGGFANSYGYNANGDQTSRTIGGTSYTLTYDEEDQLTSTGTGGATFAYDALGRRMTRTVSGTTTTFKYDGSAILTETTGSTTTPYTSGNELVHQGALYPAYDGQGNAHRWTDWFCSYEPRVALMLEGTTMTIPSKDREYYLLFFVLCLLAGAIVTIYGLDTVHTSAETAHWPKAAGKIMSAEMHGPFETESGIRYTYEITYTYAVEGETYQSNQVGDRESYSKDLAGAREMLHHYPEGKGVIVYYDPDGPFKAVLEPGNSLWTLQIPIFGLLFVFVGASGLCWCISDKFPWVWLQERWRTLREKRRKEKYYFLPPNH